MMTESTETEAFCHADRRIQQLLANLNRKRVCGCCTARALTYNGACLAEETMGSVEAAEMLEEIAASLRENNKPAPGRGMQH
jgi:hypothetical protein